MNSITGLSAKALRRAADIKERIDALQNQLSEILGSEAPTAASGTEEPKRRKFSAAARAKMRRAQKARWAKIKGTASEDKPLRKGKRKMSAAGLANIRAGVAKRMAAQGKKPAKPVKTKRKFTAAGRAALSAAAKARWAKAKAAGKASL